MISLNIRPDVPLFLPSNSATFSPIAFLPATLDSNAIGITAWPSANLAFYIPFAIPFDYPNQRVWIQNGNFAGNFDIGIYNLAGTRLFSIGSTANAGTSVPQYVAAPWRIPAGEYYMGCAVSSVAGSWARQAVSVNKMRLMGCLQQAAAVPLPATMTGAVISNAFWPYFGLTTTASGF